MSLISKSAKNLIYQSGAVALPRLLGAGPAAAVVLRYHSVAENPDYCSPTNVVSPHLFDRQMAYLARRYRVVPLDEVIDALAAGTPPHGVVAITFDDGYLDNYEIAFPILKRHGLTATFYVATGSVIDRRGFWVGWLQRAVNRIEDPRRLARMTMEILDAETPVSLTPEDAFMWLASAADRMGGSGRRAFLARIERGLSADPLDRPSDFMMAPPHLLTMAREGMTIGAHSVTHPILASLEDDEAAAELDRAKRTLDDLLDQDVRHMAYPNGPGVPANFTDATARLAARSGYASASTSLRGPVETGDDPFRLRRQGINDALGMAGFAYKLEEHRFRSLLGTREEMKA